MKYSNRILSLTFLAMSMAFASCSEQLEAPALSNDGSSVITANIVDAGVHSRTAIDPTKYANGAVGILWTPDDQIGVYGTSSRNKLFVNQSSENAKRTTFAGSMGTDSPLFAYYPYNAANEDAEHTALRGNMPLAQSYDAATGKIDGDYKYGVVRAGAEGEFDFKHLFSLLRFTVSASGTALDGDNLKSVSITLPLNRVLGGEFTFNAADGSYTMLTTDGSANSVAVTWADTPALTGNTGVDAYLSCVPDIHADDDITVTVTTDKHVATFNAKAAYDFAANTVYTFSLNLNAYADRLKVEEIVPEPEEETANCYMITTTGGHDFKATVIGNGEKGIIKGAGFHTEDPYINPVSAKLLWEDVKGFISDVTLKNGRVHYNANTNVGNAVIAVYDANGTVLWSWHIWGVGNSLPQDEEITNYNGATFMMMDRTLGAHSITSNIATLYQWGRKDPIPNNNSYWVDGNQIDIEQSYPVCTESTITIETGVQHPGELISLPYVETNRLLWGDNNITDNYTFKYPDYLDNATSEDTKGWTNQKTIYDPCPAGYRVASKYAWTGFCKNNNGSTPGNASPSSRLDRLNYVKYDNGFYFKRNLTDEAGTYYPQLGTRGATTGSLWVGGNAPYNTFNYTADYWSSAPQKNKGKSQCLSIGVYNDGGDGTIANSNNTVNTLGFSDSNNAAGVRCMRE